MLDSKLRKSTQRIATSKSTSRQKSTKKQLIEVIYTDPRGLKSYKSKSQYESKQKMLSQKSVDVKKLAKQSVHKSITNSLSKGHSNSHNVQKERERERLFERISDSKNTRKPILYDNIVTEKIAEMKWNNKKSSSLSKKSQPRSMERGKKQWDENKIPYNWDVVLVDFGHLLTKFEHSEIKEYKKIYYVGQKAKKRQKIDCNENNFDNEEKEYNFIAHDHIAYRFEILAIIGKGSYGQVFRIFDHKKKEELALKMIKNRPKFTKQAFIEIQILTHIKQKDPEGTSNIIKIKDFVIFRKHVCLVFELMSQNLYELIIRNNYNGLSLDLIRRFAIQILTALEFLRKHKIIHCDLKPENILLKQYQRSGIKIIDFGSSCFQNQTIYTYIQSRYYRAPEITLGIDYDSRIDIWSVGCILGELYTGVPLFPGENQSQQMKYLVNTIGLPSQLMLEKGSRAPLFFDKGNLKKEVFQLKTIQYFCKPLSQRIPDVGFRMFIESFLKWDAKERVTPLEALKSKWIVEGMPEHLRGSDVFGRDEQKSISSRTVRISKSNSRDKKSKLSLASINTKKTLIQRERQ